jgi:hypothetical protein
VLDLDFEKDFITTERAANGTTRTPKRNEKNAEKNKEIIITAPARAAQPAP